MEEAYRYGRPLHHLPSARSTTLEAQASSIFVTNHDDNMNLSMLAVQDIFRDRHILILGAPVTKLEFNAESLQEIRLATSWVDVESESVTSLQNYITNQVIALKTRTPDNVNTVNTTV